MNSSIAAAMMASRRSAARSARFEGFEGSTFAETTFGVLAAAALLATRLLAGFDGRWILVRIFLMNQI
jgi:hypothetical protein